MKEVPSHVKQSARDLVVRMDRAQRLAWVGTRPQMEISKRDTEAVWYLLDLVEADVSRDQERLSI